MPHNSADWKTRVLGAVVFLLFLLDIGEFVAWKVHRVMEPFITSLRR